MAAKCLDPSPAFILGSALIALLTLALSTQNRFRPLGRCAFWALPSLIITGRIITSAIAPELELPLTDAVVRGRTCVARSGTITSLRILDGPLRGLTIPWKGPWDGPAIAAGSEVAVEGTLVGLPWRRNVGGWDRFSRWRRAGAPGLLEGSVVAYGPPSSFTARLRAKIIERTRELGDAEGALLRAILLGARRDVARERVDAFRSTGLSHLLALSGLHLGILFGIVTAPLGLLPLPRRIIPGLATALLWAYGAMAGFPVSLVRALTMASFLSAGRLLRWPVRPLNTLGAAALVSLVVDPAAASDVSFQLSFAATAGILASRPILQLLPRGLAGRLVIAPMVVSLAAQVSTLPFVVFHFQQVAPLASIATLLATPFTALSLVTGSVWLALGPLHPLIERVLESGAWGALRLFGLVVELCDRLGPSPWIICRSWWTIAALPLALYLLTLFAIHRRQRADKFPGGRAIVLRTILLGAPVIVLLAILPSFLPDDSLPLTITFIDVGQGSATLIESAGGESVLVDAGFRSERWDNGAAVIAPFLKRRGTWPVTVGIVSHPDADHLGGMVSLLEEGGIEQLFDSGYDHDSPLYQMYVDAATGEGNRWATVRTGWSRNLGGGTTVELLLAPEGGVTPGHPNDASLILLVRHGRFSMLLPGDAPPRAERFLATRHMADRLTLLNAPHHGAGYGCTVPFLQRSRPGFAVISAGKENNYGHPHLGVLRRLDRLGCRIYRTDLLGAITLQTDGNHLRVDAAAPWFEGEEYELFSAPRRSEGFW